MKRFAPLLLALAAYFAPGCSDDGAYTPIEAPPAEEACPDKDGCSDAGTD